MSILLGEKYHMSTEGGQTSILSSHALYFIAGHTAGVSSVAWSPDGLVIASGSYDQTIRLWNGHTREPLHILAGHTNQVNSVAWSPDGLVLASGSHDQTVRFQGLFEEILHSRPVTIKKYLPLICQTCKTQQTRSTVMDFIDRGETFLFCVKDGKKLRLPKTPVRTTLSKENRSAVARDKVLIGMRTSYETALSSIKRYMLERKKIAVPSCFISYASGDRSQERWVVNLAKDLQKADLTVILVTTCSLIDQKA